MNIPIPTTDLVSTVATASASMNGAGGFDLRTLIGLPGLTMVEAFVNYLVETWGLRKGLAPIASFITGIVLNVGLAILLHLDIQSAAFTGIWIGLLASGWHEVTTP